MEAIYRERLESLRETLVWLADPNTVLPEWYGFWIDVWRKDGVRQIDWKEVDCQTTMCLLGWHIHRNPDQGLRLQRDDNDRYWPVLADGPVLIPLTAGIAEYFGIPEHLAKRLFMPRDEEYFYCTDRVAYARAALQDLDAYLKEAA